LYVFLLSFFLLLARIDRSIYHMASWLVYVIFQMRARGKTERFAVQDNNW